tara:strand:- start:828 stop:1127 length:300 start_codon:yes stop_codon:yes gene_type:complete
MDWLPVVAGLGLVQLFLMVFGFHTMNNRLQMAILTLDLRLAGALQSQIEQHMEGIAANLGDVNPIQAVLAQFLQGRAQNAPIVQEISQTERDSEGKFSN